MTPQEAQEKAREILKEHLHGVNVDDEILDPFRNSVVHALLQSYQQGYAHGVEESAMVAEEYGTCEDSQCDVAKYIGKAIRNFLSKERESHE